MPSISLKCSLILSHDVADLALLGGGPDQSVPVGKAVGRDSLKGIEESADVQIDYGPRLAESDGTIPGLFGVRGIAGLRVTLV